jgi:hypothetical protein
MSIAFSKLHSRQEVIAMIRHSETDQRQQHNHANADINKELTQNNVDAAKLGYWGTIHAYDQRIEEIDQHNPNKRKDRVTCFELSIPFPQLAADKWKQCEKVMLEWLQKTFGVNLINSFIHYDEIHLYQDHGEIKKSRPHIHAFVVPEVDGKLNGKAFSARKEMVRLNQALDSEIRSKLGVPFLTHEPPRHKTVEQLKQQSYKDLLTAVQDKDKELSKRVQQLKQLDDFQEMVELYKQVYDEDLEILRKKQKSR